MEALGVVQARIAEHDRRLEANHDSLATLRGQVGRHESRLDVVDNKLNEIAKDVEETRKDISSLKRAFWAAAGTLALVFVAITTLLVTIATGSA